MNTKHYLNIILFAAVLLLIFPFLSFPELWENIYVAVLAFIVGYTSMLLRSKLNRMNDHDEETSLQDYIQELKDRFREQKEIGSKEKRISEISLSNEE